MRYLAYLLSLLVSSAFAQTIEQKTTPNVALAPTPASLVTNIVPAIHLAHLQATKSPTICIIGDSTGLPSLQQNTISYGDNLWERLQRRLMEDNPGKSWTFKNFDIGGSVASQFTSTGTTIQSAGLTLPSWFSTLGNTWTSYVAAANCTSIFVKFGVNDYGNETSSTFSTNIFTPIVGYTTPADIILITNDTASPVFAPYNTVSAQNGLVANQTLQRSIAFSNYTGVAGTPPIGVIDIGRFENIFIYGRDYYNQPMTYQVPSGSPISGITSFPYTVGTSTGGDFDISVTFNSGSQWQSNGTTVSISTCDSTGGTQNHACQVSFSNASGSQCYALYYPPGLSQLANSNVSGWSSTNNTLEVSIQGDHVITLCNGTIVQDVIAPRHTNSFQPTVFVSSPPGGLTMTVNSAAMGSPATFQSSIYGTACYGAVGGNNGGNGSNHISSYCLNLVYGAVLDAVSFGTPLAIQPQITTVAALPTCGATNKGAVIAVSDATAPTYGSTLTGGSSVYALALCNGSAWVAH